MLQMRLNCLRAERRQLGYLLFVLAALCLLSGVEIVNMARRLAEKPNDDMVLYMLASTLTALDLPDTRHKHMNPASLPLYDDRPFVASFAKLLDNASEWKSPRLRAVLTLKWSLFIWVARHQDPDLVETSSLPPGFRDNDVEK